MDNDTTPPAGSASAARTPPQRWVVMMRHLDQFNAFHYGTDAERAALPAKVRRQFEDDEARRSRPAEERYKLPAKVRRRLAIADREARKHWARVQEEVHHALSCEDCNGHPGRCDCGEGRVPSGRVRVYPLVAPLPSLPVVRKGAEAQPDPENAPYKPEKALSQPSPKKKSAPKAANFWTECFVESGFRDWVTQRYPDLCVGDLRVVYHLLTAIPEEGANRVPFSYDFRCVLYGADPARKEFAGGEHLQALCEALPTLRVLKHSREEGRCTGIDASSLPPDMIAAYDRYHAAPPWQNGWDLVDLATGLRPPRKRPEVEMPKGMNGAQDILLKVLNEEPTHAASRIFLSNRDAAWEAAGRYVPQGKPKRSRTRGVQGGRGCRMSVSGREMTHKELQQLRRAYQATLTRICRDPKALYAPSATGRTTRVSAIGPSPARFPRIIRTPLLKRCVCLDLVAAQMGIVAAPAPVGWDVGSVRALLSRGKPWAYLSEQMGVPLDSDTNGVAVAKGAIKDAVYATVFGAGRRAVEDALLPLSRLLGCSAAEGRRRFLRIPEMADLWKRRKAVYARIEQDGYAYDAFGGRQEVEAGRGAHAVAASVAQSYEIKLLWPIVARLVSYHAGTLGRAFTVILWLHDGVYVRPNRSYDDHRTQGLLRAIQDDVRRVAAELKIETRLEVEYLR